MQSPNSKKGQTSVVQQCWILHSNWWWCDDDVWLDTNLHFHSTPDDGQAMKPRRVMKMCRNGVANRPCTEFRTESDVKWPTRWQCANEHDLWSGGGCTLTFELPLPFALYSCSAFRKRYQHHPPPGTNHYMFSSFCSLWGCFHSTRSFVCVVSCAEIWFSTSCGVYCLNKQYLYIFKQFKTPFGIIFLLLHFT